MNLINVGVFLTSFILILFIALWPAFMIWWLWDPVVTSIVPGMVESGQVAKDVQFWHSFGLCIICAFLFKNQSTNQDSK